LNALTLTGALPCETKPIEFMVMVIT